MENLHFLSSALLLGLHQKTQYCLIGESGGCTSSPLTCPEGKADQQTPHAVTLERRSSINGSTDIYCRMWVIQMKKIYIILIISGSE